jgi:hypothetical protein
VRTEIERKLGFDFIDKARSLPSKPQILKNIDNKIPATPEEIRRMQKVNLLIEEGKAI